MSSHLECNNIYNSLIFLANYGHLLTEHVFCLLLSLHSLVVKQMYWFECNEDFQHFCVSDSISWFVKVPLLLLHLSWLA